MFYIISDEADDKNFITIVFQKLVQDSDDPRAGAYSARHK